MFREWFYYRNYFGQSSSFPLEWLCAADLDIPLEPAELVST